MAAQPTSPSGTPGGYPGTPIEMGPSEAELAVMELDELAKALGTSLENGLRQADADTLLDKFGPNELGKNPKPSLLMLFIVQLTNIIIVLLIAAAVASILVNATGRKNDQPLSYVEGLAIFLIVILNAGIAAVTENSANDALEKLSKMSSPSARLIRDGKEVEPKSSTIVPGDIVLLGVGDIVPADVRLLEASDLKVSEMPLTGEPDDVQKNTKTKASGKLTPENCAFSGCNVTSGSAKAVVLFTGMNTRVGTIAGLLSRGKDKKKGACGGCLPDVSGNQTPLQQALQNLGMWIGVLAICVCLVVFIVGLIRSTKDPEDLEKPTWLYMILISVTLAVAAIPEGIPLCVTISLSSGSWQMKQRMVLVRNLAAVETLGSASVICTDKTGTLTEGKMRLVKMWSAGSSFVISGTGFDPTSGTVNYADGGAEASKDSGVISTLYAALLCSNARVEKVTESDGSCTWVPKGNSSEAPLIVAAAKVGVQPDDTEARFPRVFEVPFSSSRKMMLAVTKTAGQSTVGPTGLRLPEEAQFMACFKGAPDRVLAICSQMMRSDGCCVELDQANRTAVMNQVNIFSEQALRVLAIAVRPLKSLPFDMAQIEEISTEDKMAAMCADLTLVGLTAAIDPPRAGVKQAVLDAYGGHIRVIMITGDYVKTAAAIAKDINILNEDMDESMAVDCSTLRPGGVYISDEEIDHLTFQKCVFARAQPEDKLQIVESLQRQGFVSAMTGDGVNDAPALKAADIGVAMGIQGTEVAKGASDMILMDDDFCSIVNAVEKGRVIYAGIQKFVAFIMSVHIAEVMQIFFCIVVEFPIMRTPLQILFLILVTDLPPSIALGMEPGQKGILEEWPRPKEQAIILQWMWQSIVVNGFILSLVIICVFVWSLTHYVGELNSLTISGIINEQELAGIDIDSDASMSLSLEKARTVAFISLVWSENVRAYTSRSFERPFYVELFRNVHMQKAIALAQVALYGAIFIPGLSNRILKLRGASIGIEGWIVAFIGACGCLLLCELYKLVTGIQKRSFDKKVREGQVAREAARQNLITSSGGNAAPRKEPSGAIKELNTIVPLTKVASKHDVASIAMPKEKGLSDLKTEGNGANLGFLGCLCWTGMGVGPFSSCFRVSTRVKQ